MSDSGHPKRPRDANQLGKMIVDLATGETDEAEPDHETPMQTNGRNGGLKGGNARAAKLSPERRSEIAKKAAAARWEKTRSSN